ncbi:MAG: hypothetical protein ACOC37_04685, partial [Spirochaetota bacterium]
RARAAEQAILDSAATVDAIYQRLQTAEARVQQATEEANAAEAMRERNRYVVKDGDPSFLYLTGADTLNLIDESGTVRAYRITTAPDYDSGQLHPDGSVNLYPNGAETESVQPNDETLRIEPDGSYTLTKKTGERYRYDFYGKLSRIENLNGVVVTFGYEANYGLTSIEPSHGLVLSVETNEDNLITAITGPEGLSVSYGYDAAGRLESVTDTAGDTVTYGYSGTLLTSIGKPDGTSRAYRYHTVDGRTVAYETEDEEGNVEYFDYDFDAGVTTYTNPDGVVTRHHFNEKNFEVLTEYADGTTETYVYDDETNNLLRFTNRHGGTIIYGYDDRRNRTRADYPNGEYETWKYNALNRVTEHRDVRGNLFDYDYDDTTDNLRTVTITDEHGTTYTTSYTYTTLGQVKTVRSGPAANGTYRTEHYVYDSNGFLDYKTDGESNTWNYEYDGAGRMIAETDPEGNTTSYQYNGDDRVTRVDYPDSTNEQFFYTNRKDLDYQVLRDGTEVHYEYDARHLLLAVENELEERVVYTYSPAGQVLTKVVLDSEGEEASRQEYVYDPVTGELARERTYLGNVAGTDGPALAEWRAGIPHNGPDIDWAVTDFVYRAGVVERTVDPRGYETEFDYDTTGNLATVTRHGSPEDEPIVESFTYHADGVLQSSTDARGHTTSYEYNAFGDPARIHYPGPERPTVEFAYDGMGRLVSKSDELGYASSANRSPRSQRKSSSRFS